MTDPTELLELPLLPLRDVVVYPHMVIPLFVGREKSIQALEAAMSGDKQVLLVAQKNASVDDPVESDIYQIGTVSTILQLLRLPDGTVKVLVEGGFRAQLASVSDVNGQYSSAEVTELAQEEIPQREAEALLRSAMEQFEKYVNLSKKIPSE
ncbi:MAG TPA: LON peptidase substrate-binding domain-containing protein, partial [Spongiibacteraceae bacterium]|nr:LON peptidase substrate-binding domain-containing protein [Spongiibacteraceae bacterium]